VGATAIEKDSVQVFLPDAWSPPDAKPFLKWVGGKRQIVLELMKHVPAKFGRYHEPFLGGGALFFHLRQQKSFPAFLADSNARLIRAYRGIQHDVEGVIRLLGEHAQKHGRAFFEKVRDRRDVDSATITEVAAWLIYLNRTAYNGLYRVNSRNIFNVPFGKYVNPTICDADNLRACAAALKHAELDPVGFESVLDRARPGDFVYFDPPYRPVTTTSNFTTYTSDGFDDADQARLRDVALQLKKRGVQVLLSNSSAPLIEELYKDFEKFRVGARRSVNSDPAGRGLVQELVIK
jgi:DNA adenine methylase